MDILILHDDYQAFLHQFYKQNLGLADRSYEEQLIARRDSQFQGTSIYYPDALNEKGHDARTAFVKNKHMQQAWASEHGLHAGETADSRRYLRWLVDAGKKVNQTVPVDIGGMLSSFLDYRTLESEWYYDILEAQVSEYEPNVIFNKNFTVDMRFFDDIEHEPDVLCSSVGLPSLTNKRFAGNDGVISHIPGAEEEIRERGYPTTLLRHAFGSDILATLPSAEPTIPVSFVGSLSPRHETRIKLLEHLCETVPIQVWAPSVDHLPEQSPICERYQGQAWGREMYKILADSKITINAHIDGVPTPTNVRLFEATGVGTALLTDEKPGLDEIFCPGDEILTYDSPQECVSLVEYYLDNPSERRSLAKAGQRRTLADHTYEQRAETLLEFFEKLS
jgi:glycosyltransferase involved in cell wall biosynthesis